VAEESKLIENWIRGQVAKIHKKTGKAICPFAKKALQDQTIQITKAKVDLLEHIIHCCHMVPIFRLDIVVLYIDYKISEQRLATICEQAHRTNCTWPSCMITQTTRDYTRVSVSVTRGNPW